MTESLA